MIATSIACLIALPRIQSDELLRNGSFSTTAPDAWELISAKAKFIEAVVDGGSGTKAIQINIETTEKSVPWTHMLKQTLVGPTRKGDRIVFEGYLRSPSNNKVGCNVEDSKTFTKVIERRLSLNGSWQKFRMVGICDQDRPNGGLTLSLHLGEGSGVIEMTKLSVTDIHDAQAPVEALGAPYDGPNTDDWKVPAAQRIERLRKGDMRLHVLDSKGNPVPNANVEVTEINSDFRFGTAVLTKFINGETEDDRKYREELIKHFNTVTIGNELKWHTQDYMPDAIPQSRLAAKWLKQQGMFIRGHNLIWGSYQFSPKYIQNLTAEQQKHEVRQHVTDRVTEIGDMVYLWDVVNEAVAEHDLWDKIGWDQFPAAFTLAKRANPAPLLAYNDYLFHDSSPTRGMPAELKIMDKLKAAKVPWDVIGDQMHQSLPVQPVSRILKDWDVMAKYGKRIEITEYDLSTFDDKLQAEYTHDLLLAAFSHPSVDGFIMWGFWEGDHWRAKDGGAIIRKDWSYRPAMEAWDNLVLKQWRSSGELTTGSDGRASLRGFYGTYLVKVKVGDKSYETYVGHHNYAKGEIRIQLGD